MNEKHLMVCGLLCAILVAQPHFLSDPDAAAKLAWRMASALEGLGEEEEEDEERDYYGEDIREG